VVVTFTAASASGVSIDASGNVITGASLNAGDHTVTASWSDTNGDSGTVTFTLHVTAVVTNTTASDTVTTTASAAYTSTLASPDTLGTVTFTAASASGVSIDASGNVITGASLNAGDHTVTASWS